MRGSNCTEEVYRDRNTLVEVTIHRKPKQEQHKSKSQSWADSLSESESAVFKKPTFSSKQRSQQRSRSRDSNRTSNTRRQRSQDGNKENIARKVVKPCEQTDHSDLVNTIDKLRIDLERSRHEASRYQTEYNVMLQQVEISQGSVRTLETQVADLKQIISKMTRNNTELLDIVAEQIRYEEKIEALQTDNKALTSRLEAEQTETSVLKKRLRKAQLETERLRTETNEALNVMVKPRSSAGPIPSLNLGDETRDVLGFDDDRDSAIDDPRTESILQSQRSDLPSANQNKGLTPQDLIAADQNKEDIQLTNQKQDFHQLNVELSETDEDVGDGKLRSQVFDLSLRLKEIQLPRQKSFQGESLHLSLSSSEEGVHNNSTLSTLSEAKFLRGLEDSIDVTNTNMTSQSDQE